MSEKFHNGKREIEEAIVQEEEKYHQCLKADAEFNVLKAIRERIKSLQTELGQHPVEIKDDSPEANG